MAGHGEQEGQGSEALKEIKKLSPEERIRRLKELEDARKREIEEAEELIKETTEELAEEKRKIPIPEARATDMSTLDTVEGKQLVATHHFLASEEKQEAQVAPQQKKSLEEVAGEEAAGLPSAQQPQIPGFQKPAYAIGSEQQRSALGEYLSKSQQAVTGAASSIDDSPIEEKITEFYKSRAVTGSESGDPQGKYFGTHQQVTASYEMRKQEGKKQEEFYSRRAGPA